MSCPKRIPSKVQYFLPKLKHIAIIGGGVSGFGCAVKIKEEFPSYEVTVFTKDVTPKTTGDGSAGLWGPYAVEETPPDKINQWSAETHVFFYHLWRQGLAGASLLPCLNVSANPNNEDRIRHWKDIVYGFTKLSKNDLELWNKTLAKKCLSGFHYVTFTCEPTLLLPYLMDRFTKAGGKMIIEEVKSIETFAENNFDAIVNCSGLSSRYIVPDELVFPTRGQVARVKAPWTYTALLYDENYIIPNLHSVVLGGTKQKNNFNTEICPKDSNHITEGCKDITPGLEKAEKLLEWAGLRPSRKGVIRVERSDILNKGNKKLIVIHNYGHGGSGVTLFWGCASDVLEILRKALNEQLNSKL